jgi:predicted unusual protein kinase regulating ubiquinone biosynthesis (AarF/ABC1/UbiB family)
MTSLAGTGARVGLNYLKHYGRRMVAAVADGAALHEENAEVIYRTFSELKGGPLKLAQMLSIDQNLLPPAYAQQFAQSLHSAPPLSYPLVARTFRRELGRDPLEVFDRFSPEAAHGASIGQVHRAEKDGRVFAVKVQYPGVADSLRSDLWLVKPFALQVLGLREDEVKVYFEEVEAKLLEETDYGQELRRGQQIAAACADLPGLEFPRYFPDLSTRRILTMEWIEGETLDVFCAGPAGQADRDRIGQALWDFYHRQVHEMFLFHADPHPGNFVIADGTLRVLDFGCTKEITPEFHRQQFRFVDPGLLDNAAALEEALAGMDVLLPGDTREDRTRIVASCRRWLELLARPFHGTEFDFGAPDFLARIYALGDESRQDPRLRGLRGKRGSPHSVYVNRTFFGLYSLLCRLRARVTIRPIPGI